MGLDSAASPKVRTIAFPLVGGRHQFLHGLPVAASLSRRPGVEVEVFVLNMAETRAAWALLDALGADRVDVIEMRLPRMVEKFTGRRAPETPLKTERLVWWSRRIRRAACIVTLERTSSLLKRLPGRCPPMIHIPHGVGGARRAGGGGLDQRFSRFDLALLAGESDRETTVRLGLLPPERVAIVGQVKLAGLRRLGKLRRHRLFDNDRPTVLYNPHFHPRRGTWARFGRPLIEALREDRGFNLIVAPHMRLFQSRPDEEIEALRALSEPDWLIVDPGSDRSTDMTYTMAADIYLGDFSSQLYEYLIEPRPCVLIDQLGDGGRDDTMLPRMWSLGERVTEVEQIMPALRRATARHAEHCEAQRATVREAIGLLDEDAGEVAADLILARLDARASRRG